MDMDDTPDPEDDDEDPARAKKTRQPVIYNREEEIEKLRVGGSMTQNQAEISRVRNISMIQMGKYDISPWYFSPYPQDFSEEDLVYICEFCLNYYGDDVSFKRHRLKCTMLHPPGNEIYRDDNVSFFEVDGRRQRTWARNLCLLSKLFLDHKTLYYDVDPFLFYCMTNRDENGCHLIGYFSKEKESAEGYNVACILTLPQYQRQGLGRLLIAFSYELSKIEGKLGSPEKPLSDLGMISYMDYWTRNVLDIVMPLYERGEKVSLEQISQPLAMTSADLDLTLRTRRMIPYHKGEHKIVVPDALVEWWGAQKKKEEAQTKKLIDPAKIQWRPPVFLASARTWAW